MSKTIGYPHGTFSWTDLVTTDQAAAKAFYTALFGWGAMDLPMPTGGTYSMMLVDGKAVGGMSELSPEMAEMMPPMWNSYIAVDDVDAVTKRADELGGTVIEQPFDVMDTGRMSVIQDPTGGNVALWQTMGNPGAEIFNVPGAMSWNELATRDRERAAAFYTELLGWEADSDDTGYTVWTNNGRQNGGMIEMNENWPAEIPPHWTVYFAVADIEATVAKASELGGMVLMPPTPAGDAGIFAAIQDPQGARFTAIQLNQIDEPLSLGD